MRKNIMFLYEVPDSIFKTFSNILLKNVSSETGRKSPRESGAAILGIGVKICKESSEA